MKASSEGLTTGIWRSALLAVVAGLVAMTAVAAAGLAFAGAADLPPGAFPRVVAAVVVAAAGGTVRVVGDAGFLGGAEGTISAMPLSVSLVGAVVTGMLFLRPLHHHAVAGARELAARALPLTVCWLVGVGLLAWFGRRSFVVSGAVPGSSEPEGELLQGVLGGAGDGGGGPTVGFRAEVWPSLGWGLLWIGGLLTVALLMSRRAPLPPSLIRFHTALRPAASAVVALFLGWALVGALAGVVVAVTRGHAAATLALVLLGVPNLAWAALTVGFGGAWEGRAQGPFGLPVPSALDRVLRAPDLSRVDLASLSGQAGWVWWLVPAAVVSVCAAGLLMVARSPAGVPAYRHGLRFAVALALGTLVVCLVSGVEARVGLSLLGIGDTGDAGALGAVVRFVPSLARTVGVAAVAGLVGGVVGAWCGRVGRPRRGPR
ncbi:streptophobe family protein [Streptomyces sp. BI20]|uniref:streptophobe family protein n=1 Tax=Streptomyces sp. BI20 TaxID=3403460 RepID=UPI003C723B8A